MSFFSVKLAKNIRWSIHKDDTAAYELSSYPGWVLISPLSHEYKEHPLVIIGDITLIEVPYLMLLSPKGTTIRDLDINAFSSYLEAFLKGIRYFSKQAELIGMEIGSVYEQVPLFEELVEVPRLLNWPQPNPMGKVGISEYRLKTSVTWKHVASVDTSLSDFKPPISVVLLLDAVSAFIERDYIRSLLYSAMSVETVALSVLDETYTKMKAEGDSKGMLRIVSFGGRDRTIKDPVYDHLAKTANFKQRLHEQSLYMLGRSLLLENQPLYQDAWKLYNTRNKIVHMGELPYNDKGEYYYSNRKDALKSIECAAKVFEWFGISDACIIPSYKEAYVWGAMPLKESDLENYEEDYEDYSTYPGSDD